MAIPIEYDLLDSPLQNPRPERGHHYPIQFPTVAAAAGNVVVASGFTRTGLRGAVASNEDYSVNGTYFDSAICWLARIQVRLVVGPASRASLREAGASGASMVVVRAGKSFPEQDASDADAEHIGQLVEV